MLNTPKTLSVMTSWMTLSWSGVNVFEPMRFAGTCRQYSKNAMPQLMRMTFHSGTDLNLRCPYQAKVMKMFEPMSRRIVHMSSWMRFAKLVVDVDCGKSRTGAE